MTNEYFLHEANQNPLDPSSLCVQPDPRNSYEVLGVKIVDVSGEVYLELKGERMCFCDGDEEELRPGFFITVFSIDKRLKGTDIAKDAITKFIRAVACAMPQVRCEGNSGIRYDYIWAQKVAQPCYIAHILGLEPLDLGAEFITYIKKFPQSEIERANLVIDGSLCKEF